MRIVAFCGIALLLGACVTRDPYVTGKTTPLGNWAIEQTLDPVTGLSVPSATIGAMASNSLIERPRPAALQLTCYDTQPLVRLAFPFKVGSDKNSIFGYRFDDKLGHDNVDARFLHTHKTVVIEDKAELTRFVNELATSNTLVVRMRSLNGGRTIVEFRVNGAPGAIEAGFEGCPLSPPVAEKQRPRANS